MLIFPSVFDSFADFCSEDPENSEHPENSEARYAHIYIDTWVVLVAAFTYFEGF